MIIQTRDLRKSYGREEVLHGLTLSVPEGSAFALIGSNGAGKTTTLKILTNILRPSSGEARLFGTDSRRLSWRHWGRIGYVSENQAMPGRLTVSQYLQYLRPFYPRWDRQLERAILADLRLPMERRIGDLSHGMRLKMALACALPYRPELLILDEPFSGLDPLVREEFMERLLRQAGEMTILISSHELGEIEGVATDVGFLDQGRMLFQESTSDLMARVREVRVTLANEASVPRQTPKYWLQPRADGNVLTFVATQWHEESPLGTAAGELPGVRHNRCASHRAEIHIHRARESSARRWELTWSGTCSGRTCACCGRSWRSSPRFMRWPPLSRCGWAVFSSRGRSWRSRTGYRYCRFWGSWC